MKFAIPLAGGKLTPHFGHCKEFAFIEVADNQIQNKELLEPPPHEPGILPRWLADNNVSVVLAGGIGRRAIDLLSQSGIEVVTGAPTAEPELLVNQYLQNSLDIGNNACSGGQGGHDGCHGH
ncbi:MAG: NifB/NifX family molybdenum-iron cluster-binding protein [Desulfobacterales bacterium]|nr:NifB/NifX family molybdenum-iron cluster-binding protein [Desulfobacterales bacterium]